MNNREPVDVLTQSILIYEAMLQDVDNTYPHRHGGGIQSITQKSTTTFEVRLAQEERTDVIAYTFGVKYGELGIDNKKSGQNRIKKTTISEPIF